MSTEYVPVFYSLKGGPIHRRQDEPHDALAWCGVRMQFRHVRGEVPAADVTCPVCLRRLKVGRPLSAGARS